MGSSWSPIEIGTPIPPFEPVPISKEHRQVPYRGDCVVDGWATQHFVIRAASLRGYLHRYDGVPRQDDVAISYLHSHRYVMAAVADGISSATQSHVGATIAVNKAIQWITTNVRGTVEELDWASFVHNVAWELVEKAALIFGVERDPQIAEELLATTLITAVVHFPSGTSMALAHVVGIGDSGAWLLTDGRFERVLGGKNLDASIASSEVAGLPRIPMQMTPTVTEVPMGSVLLLGTDGFGDPLGSGEGAVGRLFAEGLWSPPSMLEFAHLLDFSRETFDDDRSLIGIWPTHFDSYQPADRGMGDG